MWRSVGGVISVKPLVDCILFGSIAFVAMLAGVLYPPTTGRLVVVMSHSSEPTSVYSVLENTSGWLVEKVSARTFIVESSTRGFANKLYENGALLVLNGAANYGCETPIPGGRTQVKIKNPYRRTAAPN